MSQGTSSRYFVNRLQYPGNESESVMLFACEQWRCLAYFVLDAHRAQVA